MTLVLGSLVIVAAIFAIARRVDVRLTLFFAALALGGIAGDVALIVRTFFTTFTSDQYIVPICTAMGFAYVLRQSQCDQHLVHLLTNPLRHARFLLIPGAVLVGCTVNMSIISQASTAVAVGTVLVPLLRAAGLSPTTVGATLLIGVSVGGELLNPGAPELRTVSNVLGVDSGDCVRSLVPLLAIQVAVATLFFWFVSIRVERKLPAVEPVPADAGTAVFRVNYLRAAVPVLPLALLMIVGPPFNLIDVPKGWLVTPDNAASFGNRLIGAAMLLGAGVAVLVVPGSAAASAKVFSEGAGYAFTNIVSVIVTAQCFAKGVELIGIAKHIGVAISAHPALLWLFAGGLSFAFALLCGSGMATTQGLFHFFKVSGLETELLLRVGAVVSIAAAAGRTSSPVAAVVMMCATLTGSEPLAIARRAAGPLIVALLATVAYAAFIG